MTTRATFLTSTAALLASVLAAVFWQELRAERLRTAQLQDRVSELERRQLSAPALPPQVVVGPMPSASAQPATPAVAPSAVPPQPVTVSPVPNVAIASSAATLMRDPDFCVAQKATLRGRMIQVYPDVGKVLRLSPTQSTALTELLLKHQESDSPCGPEGASGQPRTSPQARAEAQQNEIQALLGPAKYQEFQEYLPTRDTRLNNNRLRDAVAATDTPLTEQQLNAVLSSSLAESKRFRQEVEALARPTDQQSSLDYEEARLKLSEENYARQIATAQSILNPEQLAVMKNAMTAVTARQRAALRSMRAQMEARAAQPAQMQVLPR
jgi:hypothetical protein